MLDWFLTGVMYFMYPADLKLFQQTDTVANPASYHSFVFAVFGGSISFKCKPLGAYLIII